MTSSSRSGSAEFTLACHGCQARNRIDFARLSRTARCGRCGEALPATLAPVALDDGTFDDVVAACDLPVVIDFWAAWCGPCRAFAPTLERFAAENGGRVLVAKVDVDRARTIASRLGISSIPTIALFRGGREVARRVGALSGPELARFAAV